MTIVQSKLQECIAKGGMNSLERLSQQFNSTNSHSDMEDQDSVTPDIDAMDTDIAPINTSTSTKDPDKVPTKKRNKIKMTLLNNTPAGQLGAKLARKKSMKDRKGKTKSTQVSRKRTSKKKKMVKF